MLHTDIVAVVVADGRRPVTSPTQALLLQLQVAAAEAPGAPPQACKSALPSLKCRARASLKLKVQALIRAYYALHV
jgi:hypothetical protein